MVDCKLLLESAVPVFSVVGTVGMPLSIRGVTAFPVWLKDRDAK